MPDLNPTQYAVPLFVIAVLAEMIWAKLRAPEAYEPKDTLVSLSFGLGSTVAGALLGGFAVSLMLFAYEWRVVDFGPEWWAVWWAWPLCFVLDDLKYYWVHRAGHRIRLEVSSSNFPRFDRNMNTGGNNYDEATGIKVENKIHHSTQYPSVIKLPIIKK